jgi:hypothetical protein
MSEFSNYLENKILNQTLIPATVTAVTPQPYLALFTSDPTDAGNGAEASWTGYTRVPVTFSTAVTGTTSNSTETVFPAISGNAPNDPTVISHIAIFDQQYSGNMLYHSPLTNNKTLYNTDTLTFNTGSITISLN